MKFFVLVFSLLLLLPDSAAAQSCASTFAKTIGAPKPREGGNCLAVDPVNKLIYTGGYTKDSTLLIKMDQDGNVLWSKAFDMLPESPERVGGMVFDSEGMLCIAGMTDAPQGGKVYLMRFDPDAETILWANIYLSHSVNYGLGLLEKGPGGPYLMINVPFDPQNAEVVEIDRNTGAVNNTFSKHYDFGSADSFHDIFIHEGRLYATGRFTQGAAQSRMRNVIACLDASNGDPLWVHLGHKPDNVDARLYGDDIVIDQNAIYSTSHGDSDGTDVTNDELFIQKTSLDGTLAWVKHYQLPGKADVDEEIIATGDGFVIMGRNRGPSNIFMFKINHAGDVLWAHDYDFSTNDNTYFNGGATDQLVMMDDHLYFTAYAEEAGRRDLIFVKTDRDGYIDDSCESVTDIPVTVTTIEEAIFYPVDATVYTFVPEIIPVEPEVVNTSLQVENTCASSAGTETILNEVICMGDAFEGYTQAGTYTDTFALSNGCDSIRILYLRLAACDSLVFYDLNACTAYMSNGTNMDYSEFVGTYPPSCAPVSATTVHRFPPQPNKHSCTPGLENSAAMCVGALNSCTYAPGHEASVAFEVTITPEPASIFQVTGLEFFEKAPLMYDWINGESGPNNYPLRFGLRILKDGNEIYLNPDIPTNPNWSLHEFNFLEDSLFEIETPAVFRFELLPYCLVGNGATEAVWDLENIVVLGGCVRLPVEPIVAGKVLTYAGTPIPDAEIHLSFSSDFSSYWMEETDTEGQYVFNSLLPNAAISLRGHNNKNVLQGVSTLDLIALKQHLLGVKPFNRIEQYVAADINSDGIISSKDVSALQKTLIGFSPSFPGNTSWRFGQWNNLQQPAYPLNWQEIIYIESLSGDLTPVDFVGIKTGDITGDVRISQGQSPIANRSAGQYQLQIPDIEVIKGVPVTIDVYATERVVPAGIQLAWQLNGLEWKTIVNHRLALTDENFAVSTTGTMLLSWTNDANHTIAEKELLFSLSVIPTQNGRLKDMIQPRNDLRSNEIYSGEDLKDIDLVFEAQNNVLKDQLSDLTIAPNPFSQSTVIRFTLPGESNVNLSIYDAAGRVLTFRNTTLGEGPHSITISSDELNGYTGLLWCKINTDFGSQVKRMVRQQ